MATDRRLAWLLAALLVVGAVGACGDDEPGDGTGGPEVSFGEGAVPDQVPEDFPIPPGAVVGSTLVDGINTKTEMELRVREEIADVAQFFTVNLVSNGFVIDDSNSDGSRWTLEFRRNGLAGSVVITSPSPGVSQAIVTLNTA